MCMGDGVGTKILVLSEFSSHGIFGGSIPYSLSLGSHITRV